MRKSITFKGLCLAIAFTVAGFVAQAQMTNSLYLNFGFPMGKFHSKDYVETNYILTKDYIGTNAGVGIGAGYRASYRFDVGFGNVDPFVSVDLFWNRVRGKVRDAIIEENGTASNYVNVPILMGVQYNYALNDVFRPFAEFGVGYDIFNVRAEGWKDGTTAELAAGKYYAKYSVKGAFAFQVGAGCYFGDRVSVGLNLYGLGKHTINYKDKTSDALDNPAPIYDVAGNVTNQDQIDAASKNVQRRATVLALRIGFHF